MESLRTPSPPRPRLAPSVLLGLLLLAAPVGALAGSPSADAPGSPWAEFGAWLQRAWKAGPGALWGAFTLGGGGDKGLGLDPDGTDPDPDDSDAGSDPPPPDDGTGTTEEPPPPG